MKRIPLLFILLCLMARCFAPILDPRMGSGKVQKDADPTAAQMAEHQSRMRKQAQIGDVPVKTENLEIKGDATSSSGKNIVAVAGTSEERARQALIGANKKLHEGKTSPTTMGLWGLLVLVAGFFGIRLAANFATRKMPDMPKVKRVTW